MLEALKMASGVGLATILVIGALLVESNDMMSVAMFITLVKVYQRVGKKTIDFCRSAIKITRGLSALRRVIDAINPTLTLTLTLPLTRTRTRTLTLTLTLTRSTGRSWRSGAPTSWQQRSELL